VRLCIHAVSWGFLMGDTSRKVCSLCDVVKSFTVIHAQKREPTPCHSERLNKFDDNNKSIDTHPFLKEESARS
jgi:hypothetical protein